MTAANAPIDSAARRALLWLPALALLAAVLWFRVDVPWNDSWDTPGRMLEARRWGYAEWFWQHNESRKFFPRLFYLVCGADSGLHAWSGVLMQWALLVASFALLQRWLLAGERAWAVAALASLLIFSPVAHENVTWDIQFIVIVPVCALLASARLNASHRPAWLKSLGSALLALVATFTFANGLLCWLLNAPWWWRLAPGRSARWRPERWDFLYAGLGLAAAVLYFHDYVKPPQHPSLGAALQQPLAATAFFLAWIGGPWAQALTPPLASATLLGALLLGAAFLVTWRALRGWSSLPASAPAWLLLLAYGLLSGLLTTVGRFGFGPGFALPTRYVPFALWIPVAILGLAVALQAHRSRAFAVAAGGLALLGLLAWPAGLGGLERRQFEFEQGRLSLRVMDLLPLDPLLTRVHPERENLQRRAHLFVRRGWLQFNFVGAWPRKAAQQPATTQGGWYHALVSGSRVRIDGWAMLPNPTREPDFVLAGVRRADGTVELITALEPVLRRPEIGRAMQAPGLVRCGFEIDFRLPHPAPPAESWVLFAVDERGRALHRLELQRQ